MRLSRRLETKLGAKGSLKVTAQSEKVWPDRSATQLSIGRFPKDRDCGGGETNRNRLAVQYDRAI
jgi:hypothetical protein